MSTDITDHPSLASKLIELLGLPENTVSFSLHFPFNGLTTVKCVYYPDILEVDKNDELVTLLKEYRLEEISGEKPNDSEAVK